jgi:hypothetical protein
MEDNSERFRKSRLQEIGNLIVVIIPCHGEAQEISSWEKTAKSAFPKSQIWKNACSVNDFLQIVRSYPPGSVSRLIVGGHGVNTGIRLGTPPKRFSESGIYSGWPDDDTALTAVRIHSQSDLAKAITSIIIPNGTFEFQGCSSGKDGVDLQVLANVLQRRIWASGAGLFREWDQKENAEWRVRDPIPLKDAEPVFKRFRIQWKFDPED